MTSKLKRYFIFLAAIIVLAGCTRYNDIPYSKITKSNDNELKKEAALFFYDQGKYLQSLTLLEDIIPYYKGLQFDGYNGVYDTLYYTYCMANYEIGDYISAGYYFGRYFQVFQFSPRREDALFYSALCSVHNSPNYSLDQTETLNALDNLQIFIDLFPTSKYVDTCNIIMDDLRGKIEFKRFEQARMYYHTEQYKAAVVAFDSFLDEYPESTYKEEAMYLIVKSNFELAINSISSKKMERLNATIKSYDKFVAAFPNSNKLTELKGIKERAQKEIEALKSSEN